MIDHLFILFYAVTLLAGMWAAYYLSRLHKIYRMPYLRSFAYHLLFLNVLVFLELSTNYFLLNLAPLLSRKSARDIFIIARYAVGLVAAGGMAYNFSRIVAGLLEWRMDRRLMIALACVLILFAFGYGAAAASYLQTDSSRGLDVIKSAMNVTVIVVLLASLAVLLIRKGAIPEKGRRRVITAFASLYLVCVAVISSAVLLDFPLEGFFVSLLLILMNLFPVVWSKGFFIKHYGEAAPVAFHGIILERIIDAYQLSRREKEILELVLQGKSNKEIRDLLYISVRTVRNHVYNIYQKLGVKSRGQLVHLVMEAQKKS